MLENMPWLQSHEAVMTMRLVAAAVLGGIVGIERGSGDRPAGLRTHILVCVGSALFMLVSIYGFDNISPVDALHEADMGSRRDSARIAAQVVSGIGFLGAGTILHEGLTIRGLTTAASLWTVSAIGLAVGSGMLFLSAVATVITLITLGTFHTWEKRFAATSRAGRRFVRVTMDDRMNAVSDLTGYLSLNGVQMRSINVKKDKDKSRLTVDLYLKINKEATNTDDIIDGIYDIEGVNSVNETK